MKQNNCQGCGCINEDQCICMKEEYKYNDIMKEELINIMKEQYKGKYITHHPAGVDITFNSWEEYNKYMVYENKIRKGYCEQGYETGIKDGIKKAKESNGLQNLLIYEAGVEDGVAKAKKGKTKTVEYPEKKDKPTTYVNVDVQVKVDSVAEFIDIWDVLYPRGNQ